MVALPTQTFFNLPEEKRTRIINAALKEFATLCFDHASVAHIIKMAGIPRGSFYQYFNDLKDLYKFIIDLTGERKISYLKEHVPQFEGKGFDFFQTLRDLCIAGLRFAEENPELLAIGNNFLKEPNKALKDEVMGEQLLKAQDIYTRMVQKGIELGQINPQIDPLLAGHFLGIWSASLSEYYIFQLQTIAANPSIDEISLLKDPQSLKHLDQMLDLLAHGLANKSPLGGEHDDDPARRQSHPKNF